MEIVNPENIKQIKDVLRLKVGEKIILLDGLGNNAEAVIDCIYPNKIICTVTKIEKPASGKAPARQVNLYLAILKKENFELAVQKAVECGVSKITPIITERTIKTGLNLPRLEKIIREASEQCGRNVVPSLPPILDFQDALKDGEVCQEKIIFHLAEKEYRSDKNATTVSIFVGPEGGFTDKEILMAKNSGYTAASLGPLTLRGETAAIVATYRAVYAI